MARMKYPDWWNKKTKEEEERDQEDLEYLFEHGTYAYHRRMVERMRAPYKELSKEYPDVEKKLKSAFSKLTDDEKRRREEYRAKHKAIKGNSRLIIDIWEEIFNNIHTISFRELREGATTNVKTKVILMFANAFRRDRDDRRAHFTDDLLDRLNITKRNYKELVKKLKGVNENFYVFDDVTEPLLEHKYNKEEEYFLIYKPIMFLQGRPHAETLVWFYLLGHQYRRCKNGEEEFQTTNKMISEDLGMAIDTVKKALNGLRETGKIETRIDHEEEIKFKRDDGSVGFIIKPQRYIKMTDAWLKPWRD